MDWDLKINSRRENKDDIRELLNKYDRMKKSDLEVLEKAVQTFFTAFGKNPIEFEFDFRFNRR